MQSIQDYFDELPEDRKAAMQALWQTLTEHLPEGFEAQLNYKMPSFVVPHSLYPKGYHVDPSLPLPFISIASQKSHIALYHSGLYSDPELLDWFEENYPKYSKYKLNMGKSCVRFRNPKTIPLELIAKLAAKMTAKEWIARYENARKG